MGNPNAMAAARMIFLFNHDAVHQVAHLGGIVRAMRTERPDVRIICATGMASIRHHLEGLLGETVAREVEWLDLGLPGWMDGLLSLPNTIAPVKRLARLDHHAGALLASDVLVSAERTCLRLRRRQAALGSRTQFVHVPHGAGDRAVTFHRGKAGFDRILVAGDKTARELVARGAARADQLRVVGYSKFDAVGQGEPLRPFDNERPTFLYNPHFDPFLSSWYDEGPALLDWFARGAGQRFNLIFAPHIMLFRKTLHVSLEYRTARLRPGIRPDWRNAPNILIDTGSDRLVDMSYTLCADAYIGDVSSQIYEFLIRPRPAFFIDRFSRDARSREGRYPAWEAGDVVRSAGELVRLLPGWRERLPLYRDRQAELFADTMSHDPARSASQRAVDALMELVEG
jgi:hypothetical protein